MSLKNYKILGLAALTLGCASAAQAGFVTTSNFAPGADTRNIVGNNEFKGVLHGLGVDKYTLGAQLGLDEAGSVTYYYYGKEAGYQNVFLTDNLVYASGFTPHVQNYFANPIKIGTVDNLGVGSLDFAFCAFSGPISLEGCVSNSYNDLLGWNSYQSIAYSVAG